MKLISISILLTPIGFTLVVSPLVSLMEDQLMALQNLGVSARLLNAASSKEEVKEVQDGIPVTL